MINKRPSTPCVPDQPIHLHVIPLFPNTHLGVSCKGLLPHRWSRHVRGHDCGTTEPKTTILFSRVARQATGAQPNQLSAKQLAECEQWCKERNDGRKMKKGQREEKNRSCSGESLSASESHTLLVISFRGLLLWPWILIGLTGAASSFLLPAAENVLPHAICLHVRMHVRAHTVGRMT